MKPKSFDGNAINDGTYYEAFFRADNYGLPKVGVSLVKRDGRWPVVAGVERGGKVLYVDIYIRSGTLATYQKQLMDWFDPEGEVSKKLLAEDQAGGNDRYVYAICQELVEVPNGAGRHFVAGLVVDGDVRWREASATTDTWNITATGQTKVLANGGEDDAYPTLQIKPTSAKTGGYGYKKFIRVLWKALASATSYPTDICADGFDTAALVSASKMQADGDDLRVLVDGVEVDRWLDGINSSTTKVWCNITWQAAVSDVLGVAIASSGAITTITGTTDISGFPSSGILMIDDEVFTYTGKSNSAKQFTGVTRAAKGTSMAAHTTADAIYWLQHEIYILYGNASVSAPVVDAKKEPIFELDHSTNGSWVYESFFDVTTGYGSRPGAWQRSISTYTYGSDHGGVLYTGEFTELGVKSNSTSNYYWNLHNPCGITAANFTNGEKYADDITKWSADSAGIFSSPDGGAYDREDSIAAPSTNATWESWSDNETLTAGSKYILLNLSKTDGINASHYNYIEAADVTLTINSSYIPTVGIGAEEGSYSLDCTITNNTTGEAIELDFTMVLNQELEVNTDDKTVTYLADGSNQFQALTVKGGPRKDWLKLQPGNNTIQFDDTGTDTVTVDFDWDERRYH